MKKIITILSVVFLAATLWAQSPEKMSYQAVIRDANGNLLSNHSIGMQLSILQGNPSGTAVYVERQYPSTNTNGLVTLEIGNGIVVSGDFTAIDWANGPYFLKSETDLNGGATYTIIGTSQLLSVPYALHAKTADSITGINGGGFAHYIGELYGGGIVVSVWKENGVEHGLISALEDVYPTPVKYSSVQTTLIGITAQSPTNGQANTAAIVAQGDLSGAAYLCDNYSSGDFNDWYLPAVWELNECYDAVFIVNTILGANNGFIYSFGLGSGYWSSTEIEANMAISQSFVTGVLNEMDQKYKDHRARCIRRF